MICTMKEYVKEIHETNVQVMYRVALWGWWDRSDNIDLQKHDSKIKLWPPDVEQATSRSQRLPTMLILHDWAGKKHFVSLTPEYWKQGSSCVTDGSDKHCTS